MCDTFYSTESRVWSKSRAEGVEPVSEHEQNYIGTMSTEYYYYLFALLRTLLVWTRVSIGEGCAPRRPAADLARARPVHVAFRDL